MPPIGVVSSATPQATAVPEDVITDAVLDDVKTRICFVGDPMSSRPTSPAPSTAQGTGTGEDSMSESEGRRSESSMSMDVDRPRAPGLSHPPSSSASSSRSRRREARTSPDRLRDLYVQQSRATELTLRIAGPSTTAPGAVVSRAGLRVPGWIRERAAEVLFEYGDVDEAGCAELILDSLLKVFLTLGALYKSHFNTFYACRHPWTFVKNFLVRFWLLEALQCYQGSYLDFILKFYVFLSLQRNCPIPQTLLQDKTTVKRCRRRPRHPRLVRASRHMSAFRHRHPLVNVGDRFMIRMKLSVHSRHTSLFLIIRALLRRSHSRRWHGRMLVKHLDSRLRLFHGSVHHLLGTFSTKESKGCSHCTF